MRLISTQYNLSQELEPRFQIRCHNCNFVSAIRHVMRGMVQDAEVPKEHEKLVRSALEGLNGWDLEFRPRQI